MNRALMSETSLSEKPVLKNISVISGASNAVPYNFHTDDPRSETICMIGQMKLLRGSKQ